MNTGAMTKRYRAYKMAAPKRTVASILVAIHHKDVGEMVKEN